MSLNKKGMELPDNRSLVSVADLRPVTMGERVMRYHRPLELRDDLYHDEKYDPDDFHDDDDRMMSPHEERAGAFIERRKARKMELDRLAEEKARKEADEENERFRERVRAVKDDIPLDSK
nr:MAG: hypothetical protein [Microvirus sp.]